VIIVEGWLHIAADEREDYLRGCRNLIEQARTAEGCLAFSLTADPLDPQRINVLERWSDVETLTRFRGSGPSDDQQASIIDAEVYQYVVASQVRL
jgi:quinol monooxygenase YgiN